MKITTKAYARSEQLSAIRRRIQLISSPTLDQRPADKKKVEELKAQYAKISGKPYSA